MATALWNLLTRLTAAIFFPTPTDETKLADIWEELDKHPRLTYRKNEEMIGKKYKILIDECKEDEGLSIGRCYKDAPEIDNIVILNEKLNAGSFVDARIISASAYDVQATLV